MDDSMTKLDFPLFPKKTGRRRNFLLPSGSLFRLSSAVLVAGVALRRIVDLYRIA